MAYISHTNTHKRLSFSSYGIPVLCSFFSLYTNAIAAQYWLLIIIAHIALIYSYHSIYMIHSHSIHIITLIAIIFLVMIYLICNLFIFSFLILQILITEGSNVEDFHRRWRLMEQAWLYPEGKKIPKEFNHSIPMEVEDHFKNVAQNFHVPTVSIK